MAVKRSRKPGPAATSEDERLFEAALKDLTDAGEGNYADGIRNTAAFKREDGVWDRATCQRMTAVASGTAAEARDRAANPHLYR